MTQLSPFRQFIRQALLYPLTSPFLPPVDKVQKDFSYSAGQLVGTFQGGTPAEVEDTQILFNLIEVLRSTVAGYYSIKLGAIDGFSDETGIDDEASLNYTFDNDLKLFKPSITGGATVLTVSNCPFDSDANGYYDFRTGLTGWCVDPRNGGQAWVREANGKTFVIWDVAGSGQPSYGWAFDLNCTTNYQYNHNSADITAGWSGGLTIVLSGATVQNMSLYSAFLTLPDYRDFVVVSIIEKDVDSIVLGVDLKVFVTRFEEDWVEADLIVSDIDAGENRVLYALVDLSGLNAGTALRYKIETHNNKRLNIFGAGTLAK